MYQSQVTTMCCLYEKNIDPINTNILRLYPERPRDEYHAVNVCYLEEVNKSEDFETNPGSPNSINEA